MQLVEPVCAIGELGIAAHWAWFGYRWDQQATGQWLEQQWYAFDAFLCSPANQVALGVLYGGEDFGGGTRRFLEARAFSICPPRTAGGI